MFKIEENESSVSFSVSAEMKLVDRVVKESGEFLSELSDSEFSPVKMVMRELLINAVEHGCDGNSSMTVRCLLERLDELRYRIRVEDGGNGFDWKSLNLSLPESSKGIRSRGYPLINTLSDAMEFESNGSVVTAYLTVSRQTDYDVSCSGDLCSIAPNGDITAASSESLKNLLLDRIAFGSRRFSFDLAKVSDIDSVGLSVLMILARTLEAFGSKPDLEISNPSEDIVRLFQMTMLDTIFKLRIPSEIEEG